MALRPSEVISLAAQEGVPPELALAVYEQESSFGTNISGPNSLSIGGFQVTPGTFQEMLPGGDINNERDNALAGIKYLKKGLEASGGDIAQTAGFYHAGPDYVGKLSKNPNLQDALGKKTVAYMADVLTKTSKYQQMIEEGTIGGGQQQSSTLPTKEDPMAAINVLYNQMRTSINLNQQQLADFTAKSTDIAGKYREQSDQLATFMEDAGLADAGEVRARSAAKAQTAAEASRVLSDSGINSADVRNNMSELLIKMRESKMNANQLRAEIDKQNVDFLEDPIQWISSQFTLGPLVRKHNAYIADYNAGKNELSQMTELAHNINIANKAKEDVLLVAAEEGKAQSLLLHSKAKATEARQQSMLHDNTFLVQQMAATERQISNTRMVASALMEKENLQQQMEGKQMQKDADAMELQQWNTAGSRLGLQPFNSVKDIMRLPAHTKEALGVVRSSGGVKLGQNFFESWRNVNSGNREKLPDNVKSLLPLATITYNTAFDKANEIQNRSLSKEDRQGLLIKTADAEANSWQNDVYKSADRMSNPYKAAPVNVMTTNPDVQQMTLGKILTDYKTAHPGLEIDDKQLISLVKTEFLKGKEGLYKRPEDAAADIVRYYTAAIATNNKAHDFYGWGLPVQDRYIFTDEQGKKVNWVNYGNVMRALIDKSLWEKTKEFIEIAVPGSPF